MASTTDCTQNIDPLRLVREGTSQDQRYSPSLDPSYAQVSDRKPADDIVFAEAYSAFLKYYDSNDVVSDDWKSFFSEDVSVRLATAAVQDVESYRSSMKAYLDYLGNSENKANDPELKNKLGCLFSCIGTLVQQLDVLKEGLPEELSLNGALGNLIQNKLALPLKRLIAYFKAGVTNAVVADAIPSPEMRILACPVASFLSLQTMPLSKDWIADGSSDWGAYYAGITEDSSVYGNPPGASVFDKANHIATDNLFTSILDQFLKVYARTVSDAESALEDTMTTWDSHDPHYALFLAFLRLFEHVRAEMNTLTGRHLDFYYREILQLKEKSAEPGSAHLLAELAKQAATHDFKPGDLFKAGKDDKGIDAFYANDGDFVANKALVTALKTVYRYVDANVGISKPIDIDDERLFASPVANSADGLGAELTTVDKSWQPFFNKIYEDGSLSEIRMPKAELGFAIASHYLLMAEGTRTITLTISGTGTLPEDASSYVCRLTTGKAWLEKDFSTVVHNTSGAGGYTMTIKLDGSDPAITPYSTKIHGYNLDTNLPVLLITLRQSDQSPYTFKDVEDFTVETIELLVDVKELKTLAVSNDFGPIDTSKPFKPFGSLPVKGSSLVIGSKEVFQKNLKSFQVHIDWQIAPISYPSGQSVIATDNLEMGMWKGVDFIISSGVSSSQMVVSTSAQTTLASYADPAGWSDDQGPDLGANELFNSASRRGFVRLRFETDFGQDAYLINLAKYLSKVSTSDPTSKQPVSPSVGAFWVEYTAAQVILLNTSDAATFENRQARLYHFAPFGQAEQHPYLKTDAPDSKMYLFPQFRHLNTLDPNRPLKDPVKHEAEFYVGVTGLVPPQNLALLFQVVDGTADPLAEKPVPHIHWSYLRQNEWITFASNEVEDQTGELLNSGIVTFAVPRDAVATNTLMPQTMHWIRAAVESESAAVCRLLLVAAQAMKTTFKDTRNDPSFPAKVLVAGTISKLDQPSSDVKTISQPFPSFGGRGKEIPASFYTRTSERLRHKDRAIALWDYERLVLEAFPQIYKAKCLNHTHYEPDQGIYRELAPGHVSVVTIPNQQFQNLQDPLRPFTSLGLLKDIEKFLVDRLSCFVKLHVKNPLFEVVRVSFNVRLNEGFDESYSVSELQKAITRFLSPWAFSGAGSPSFGGKIYKSVLINFVEDQRCVDYVTDFHLYHTVDEIEDTTDPSEVAGSKAVSILVSAPAKKHEITVIKYSDALTAAEQCSCET